MNIPTSIVRPAPKGPTKVTGAGPHGDRRTKRNRTRSDRKRRAIAEQGR